MHIPDGFLSTQTWITLDAVSLAAVGLAVKKVERTATEKQVPLMGVMAAFVFAAQMVNFPVAAGTSGHFVGSVLTAVLLGPLTALLIMACILAVQCLVFQDGGLMVLGANIFNMGIVGVFGGYGLYRLLKRPAGRNTAAALAAWGGSILAASACALELAVSGTVSARAVLPAMAGVHALIGIGEAIITFIILRSVAAVRPDLLELDKI